MPVPLIGITTGRRISRNDYMLITLVEAYSQAVTRAGGAPVLIPLGLPESYLSNILNRLDGLLLSGGGDIDPGLYGNPMHPMVNEVDTDRDRVEMYVCLQALQREMPVLGVCRGLQVMNVALGGTLFEDIADQRPGSLQHRYWPGWARDHLAHNIDIIENSLLSKILGSETLMVNSLHHQGINRLSPHLQATATAPDGLIEAVELPGYPFGLAVQWHPEWLPEEEKMQALFKALIEAATHPHHA